LNIFITHKANRKNADVKIVAYNVVKHSINLSACISYFNKVSTLNLCWQILT